MKVGTFERKSFRVRAVQVTAEDMEEIAKWCGGEVRDADRHPDDTAKVIAVNIGRFNGRLELRNMNKLAWEGDWITWSDPANRWQVYRGEEFKRDFSEVVEEEQRREKIEDIIERALSLNPDFIVDTTDDLVKGYTAQILELFS